jgi:hypothetical protein
VHEMEIPRIASTNAEALRQRRQLENETRIAQTVQRAQAHWRTTWQSQNTNIGASPLAVNAAPAPVAVTYKFPEDVDAYWATLTVGGLRRDKLVLYSHAAAMAVHITLLTLTAWVAASSDADPNLSMWRQRCTVPLILAPNPNPNPNPNPKQVFIHLQFHHLRARLQLYGRTGDCRRARAHRRQL